jgi:streptomycin 6-kinase
MRELHDNGLPDPTYRSVADRVAYLFESSRKLYEFKPDLVKLVAPELYERSRERALQLATDPSSVVLLHGDLTAVNILDGGDERGLVAIDPAPCLGDPAFDAVDLMLWKATTVETIVARAEKLAQALALDSNRVLEWCAVFAAMNALEIAEKPSGSLSDVAPLIALASRV